MLEPSRLLPAPRHQIRADERLQVSIQYAIHVTDFGFGAVILDHAIRLQHVGANLRPEFNIEFRVFDFLRGRAFFFHLEFVELRAQHAHGAFPVLMLRTLVLATGDEAGGNVRDAYGRVGRVYVLPTLATRPISIGADIFRLDDDFDAVVDFRGDVDAGE